jgi:hypothetical protein
MHGKASQGSGVCERLDRIEEMLSPPQASPEAYAAALLEEYKDAWWEAYGWAFNGLLAAPGEVHFDSVVSAARQLADAALSARKARWDDPTPAGHSHCTLHNVDYPTEDGCAACSSVPDWSSP